MNLLEGYSSPPLDVSRETSDRLEAFSALLKKWNRAINLISPSTLDQIWDRHIVDSAQVVLHAPRSPRHWADLGSGGGLPGIVVGCILAEKSPTTRLTMIESDVRKAAFLRTTLRELDLEGVVLTTRIEETEQQDADVVSARALAALPQLLGYVSRHLSEDGIALLQKGQNARTELDAARQDWIFACSSHTSITETRASILAVRGLRSA